MLKKTIYPAVLLAFAIGGSSCVSMKRYNALNEEKMRLETEKAVCDENLQTSNTRIQGLTEANRKLVDMSATEQERLNRSLAAREADLQARDKDLETERGQVQRLSGDLKTKEQRMQELERALAEQQQAVTKLRTTVQNALLGFKASDLTIDIKHGKVYVSLAEQLLFKSGSTKVDPKGADALQRLGQVLQQQPDVNVVVEGHTDDVPISRGTTCLQDNWDLSVLRATEITRILKSAGVPGSRITPSGRADNLPLVAERTAEARQRNRRTEIILTPQLDELFQMLEQN